MRVLYDYQVFSMQAYGGVSRLFCELIRHIAQTGINVTVFGGMYINEYIAGFKPVYGFKVRPLRGTGFARGLLNHAAQQVWSLSRPADIVHCTYYAPYLRCRGNTKTVLTLYDMIHERLGRKVSKTAAMKKYSCRVADAIIAISESTKNDVVQFLQIDPSKVTVIYPGNSMILGPTPKAATNGRQDKGSAPYILYVGARGAHKNFGRFIEAFAQSRLVNRSFRVLCFGGGEFSADEQRDLVRLGVASAVDRVGGRDEDLAACYSNARAFVYPSLFEGFGFPPLEAMSLGCPVICSNISSIPEVVGTAGAYFDPQSSESIQETLEHVLFDDFLIADLAIRGRDRSRLFSWQKCARETADVYRSLALGS